MKPITAIIIDDEPSAIENLKILLAEIDYVIVAESFTKAPAALDWLLENHTDVIFLDVEMPNMTGLEFLEELEKYPDKPCIIFTTGFEKYAINAIKKSAFDYLLKPVSIKELETSLRKLKVKLNTNNNNSRLLKFNSRRGFILVRTDEIFYVESEGNYCHIHKTNGNHELITIQIGKIMAMLPVLDFSRISRTHIVNCKYVSKVDAVSGTCGLEYKDQKADCKIPKDKIAEISQRFV